VVFQSFIFGKILANFGNFGQFWADFAALIVANNMRLIGKLLTASIYISNLKYIEGLLQLQ
jgi:hypothetical protein